MGNMIKYNDIALSIGDTVAVDYKIKEADNKERIQQFEGILIKIRGSSEPTRMITVRKTSKSGIIYKITVSKVSQYKKARAYFIRDLSLKNTRQKLYREK